MAIIIFDLDGTVIDTSHRYRNKPDGTIDLDYWFANSTPEMIARDKLLPLANAWRRYYADNHTIVVCTARDFTPLNGVDLGVVYLDFLESNGLYHHACLHRSLAGPDHESLGDGELKTRLLNAWARENGFASISEAGAIMFDDNVTVIREMIAQRVICYDAEDVNAKLERGERYGLNWQRLAA